MQRADKRRYHYIYKITRDDGKYYIGMHSTDNLADGYFGSGKLITRSIKKHGLSKHRKEIVEFLDSRIELKIRECELITEEIVNDILCMNLRQGGDGWGSKEASDAAVLGNRSKHRNHKLILEKVNATKLLRGSANYFGGKHDAFKGKTHSVESRIKIGKANSITQSGENNSQFGTCWVTDGVNPRKIKKEQLDEYISNGFSKGRK